MRLQTTIFFLLILARAVIQIPPGRHLLILEFDIHRNIGSPRGVGLIHTWIVVMV